MSTTRSRFPDWQRRAALTCLLFGSALAAQAQVVRVPSSPQIGSSNPITAEPPVSRPHTQPCVVQLFQSLRFADFTPKVFAYAPPAGCLGPWARVVLSADFTVTAGRQFDRTAAFYLGHANIYYGTTAEPRATLSPSWHVERDVTDLTPIFESAETGEANIGNFVQVLGSGPNDSGFGAGTKTILEVAGPGGSAVVNLEGSGKLDLNDLLKHNSLILPPH